MAEQLPVVLLRPFIRFYSPSSDNPRVGINDRLFSLLEVTAMTMQDARGGEGSFASTLKRLIVAGFVAAREREAV